MPSSLASTRAGSPVRATAAAGSGSLAASIGCTAVPTASPTDSSAASPPSCSSAAAATVEERSIAARRTAATGTSYATASASCTAASEAP